VAWSSRRIVVDPLQLRSRATLPSLLDMRYRPRRDESPHLKVGRALLLLQTSRRRTPVQRRSEGSALVDDVVTVVARRRHEAAIVLSSS
jgi:hypothetical protein